ncbi:unnamed protein product [Brassicogethes aeneus]|uniref:C-type lectin domain-containing protein n=1 Tax=Brassicogethes aeneus TaxID=1431903 RepID=A0A9P0B0T5_BRAAE|nr:unnamed protein product [Brassicogethes aeneus]
MAYSTTCQNTFYFIIANINRFGRVPLVHLSAEKSGHYVNDVVEHVLLSCSCRLIFLLLSPWPPPPLGRHQIIFDERKRENAFPSAELMLWKDKAHIKLISGVSGADKGAFTASVSQKGKSINLLNPSQIQSLINPSSNENTSQENIGLKGSEKSMFAFIIILFLLSSRSMVSTGDHNFAFGGSGDVKLHTSSGLLDLFIGSGGASSFIITGLDGATFTTSWSLLNKSGVTAGCCKWIAGGNVGLGLGVGQDSLNLTDIGNKKIFLEYIVSANWYEAYRACKVLGLDLFSIETIEIHDAISAALVQKGFNITNPIWTSGTCLGTGDDRDFYWMSTGEPIATDIWGLNQFDKPEPNNRFGNEDCVQMRFPQGWYLNDEQCQEEFYFLCEKLPCNSGKPASTIDIIKNNIN